MSEEQLIATPTTFGENGNFLLERELGRGGMGGVYMGRDKMLDRPIAVKVMLKEYGSDEAFLEKFRKEARAAAQLLHPNISQIYSYGVSDGMPYIAMELVAGGSLDLLMKNAPGKTDVTRVLKIGEQVAQALRCSADRGFVHGDVKPENILLDANGNAKLVDFGLAAMQKDRTEIWGTPYYISPERVQKLEVDFRADMYSLGATLYHALTGVAPFEGEDANAVVRKRFEGLPPKPSEVRADLTPAIDELVMKLLAFDKNDRYPSFEAVVAAFNQVLTTGLNGAPSAKPSTGGSSRKLIIKSPHRTSTTAAKPVIPERIAAAKDDEEEEGGNVGAKVAGVIVGVIALIALVGGLLYWYVESDRKAKEAADQAQITSNIAQARQAIAETRAATLKFADTFTDYANVAVKSCEETTKKLKEILPEFAERLKPAPTKELLDAIALTNQAAQAKSEDPKAKEGNKKTDAKPSVAKPTPAPAPSANSESVNRFRAPTEEEKDPMSPEGQDYLKAKAAWEEEQRKNPKPKAPKTETVAATASSGTPANNSEPEVVIDMAKLWESAYSCEAAVIKIRFAASKVVELCDTAENIKGDTRANMESLAALSRDVGDKFEAVKLMPEVANAQKASGTIKSRGTKTLTRTINELKRKKAEAERAAKAKEEAEAKEARLKAQAEARAELIESERAGAKTKFDAIVASGAFNVLDWSGALRQLNAYKEELKTPEGEFAVNDQIHKVTAMQFTQEVIRRNLTKGFTFESAKLKRHTVKSVDDKELRLIKPDGKTQLRLTWVKFYKEYHGNLNELFKQFVRNGRRNGTPKLSLKEWADAMCGAALTMQLICSETPGAVTEGERLAKQVVTEFGDYRKTVEGMFPEIDFSEVKSQDDE